MKVLEVLEQQVSQAEFAAIIGVSEARVSQLVSEGVVQRGDTVAEWIVAYCERMRDIAAGRAGLEVGGLDLVQERAALAREQRLGHEIKNEVARKTYGPIMLLAETLATASQAVVEQFDQLPGTLKKSCPDLPDEARAQVMRVIAAARNEWVARTQQLVADQIEAMELDTDEEVTP